MANKMMMMMMMMKSFKRLRN